MNTHNITHVTKGTRIVVLGSICFNVSYFYSPTLLKPWACGGSNYVTQKKKNYGPCITRIFVDNPSLSIWHGLGSALYLFIF